MDSGSFGSFAQRMFNAGLVFNIHFTEDELEQLPRWSLFDSKIMDQISTLPGGIQLPPRPSNTPSSANATLWMLVRCHIQSRCNDPGRRVIHFNPPAVPITPMMYSLETLIRELAMPNPISHPDDTPAVDHLIVIGMFLNLILNTNCIEFSKLQDIQASLWGPYQV
jgi:hypothetical protein